MNIRFLAVLLGACLVSSSLSAKGWTGGVRALKAVPMPKMQVPRVPAVNPSVGARVAATVRRQTPALRRLTKIQTYRITAKEWRIKNPVLAKQLDSQGFLFKELGADAPASHVVSTDGISWYAADEMLVKAIKDGRSVRFGADGTGHFSLYQNGPEFEFYDEQLFKELATKLKPYEGRLNIRIVYARTIKNGNKFMLQDSKGALHEVGELDAVLQAEKALSLPVIRVEAPKIEVPVEYDFKEIL